MIRYIHIYMWNAILVLANYGPITVQLSVKAHKVNFKVEFLMNAASKIHLN